MEGSYDVCRLWVISITSGVNVDEVIFIANVVEVYVGTTGGDIDDVSGVYIGNNDWDTGEYVSVDIDGAVSLDDVVEEFVGRVDGDIDETSSIGNVSVGNEDGNVDELLSIFGATIDSNEGYV